VTSDCFFGQKRCWVLGEKRINPQRTKNKEEWPKRTQRTQRKKSLSSLWLFLSSSAFKQGLWQARGDPFLSVGFSEKRLLIPTFLGKSWFYGSISNELSLSFSRWGEIKIGKNSLESRLSACNSIARSSSCIRSFCEIFLSV